MFISHIAHIHNELKREIKPLFSLTGDRKMVRLNSVRKETSKYKNMLPLLSCYCTHFCNLHLASQWPRCPKTASKHDDMEVIKLNLTSCATRALSHHLLVCQHPASLPFVKPPGQRTDVEHEEGREIVEEEDDEESSD